MRSIKDMIGVDYEYNRDAILGAYIQHSIVDETTGEVFIEAGDEITEEMLERIESLGIESIKLLDINYVTVGPYILHTFTP